MRGPAHDRATTAVARQRARNAMTEVTEQQPAPPPGARVLHLPGAALREARDEVAGIWREARELSRAGWAAAPGDGRPAADQVYFAWYAGLVAMAALRVIEWRLAAVIGAVHTVERYTHRRRLEQFFEGIDAGV
jgi:hypothetical protein